MARACPCRRCRPQEAQSRERWGYAGSTASLGAAHARRRTLATGILPALASNAGSRARAAPRFVFMTPEHRFSTCARSLRLLAAAVLHPASPGHQRGDHGRNYDAHVRHSRTHPSLGQSRLFLERPRRLPLLQQPPHGADGGAAGPDRVIPPTRATLVATCGCERRGWPAATLPPGQLPRSGDRQGPSEMLRAGDSFPRPRRG